MATSESTRIYTPLTDATCTKLGVSFWDYLGHRLRVPGADSPDLPELVRLRSALT